MPINSYSKMPRVLPANHGSVDIAKNTLDDILAIQRLRRHNAFRVNAYHGIIYHVLRSGIRCHCQGIAPQSASNLNTDGSARVGFLNEMLTGIPFRGLSSGERLADIEDITGPVPRDPPGSALAPAARSSSTQVVNMNNLPTFREDANRTPRLPDIFSTDETPISPATRTETPLISPQDVWTNDPTAFSGSTHISSGGGGAMGPINDIDFDTILSENGIAPGLNIGASDAACPVCMGKGWVGGFSLMNGYRIVLNYQHPDTVLNANDLDLNVTVPIATTKSAVFSKVMLPANPFGIDALRVWRNTAQVTNVDILIDNVRLTSKNDLMRFCDGRPHTVTIDGRGSTFEFSHLEIQVDQSKEDALFDLPNNREDSFKQNLDLMQDMDLVLSPMVPKMNPYDLIAESTYWRILEAVSVTGEDDANRTVLGWKAFVRVVQPTELYVLLPRRSRREQPLAPASPSPYTNNFLPGAR